MARGWFGPVTELPRGPDGDRGFGFTFGTRFSITLVYPTEREATVAREKAVEMARGAEITERWQKR